MPWIECDNITKDQAVAQGKLQGSSILRSNGDMAICMQTTSREARLASRLSQNRQAVATPKRLKRDYEAKDASQPNNTGCRTIGFLHETGVPV